MTNLVMAIAIVTILGFIKAYNAYNEELAVYGHLRRKVKSMKVGRQLFFLFVLKQPEIIQLFNSIVFFINILFKSHIGVPNNNESQNSISKRIMKRHKIINQNLIFFMKKNTPSIVKEEHDGFINYMLTKKEEMIEIIDISEGDKVSNFFEKIKKSNRPEKTWLICSIHIKPLFLYNLLDSYQAIS